MILYYIIYIYLYILYYIIYIILHYIILYYIHIHIILYYITLCILYTYTYTYTYYIILHYIILYYAYIYIFRVASSILTDIAWQSPCDLEMRSGRCFATTTSAAGFCRWRVRPSFFAPRIHGTKQGLLNVPFWVYWTSPYSSHLVDQKYLMESNGWMMWNMGTFNDPCKTAGKHRNTHFSCIGKKNGVR